MACTVTSSEGRTLDRFRWHSQKQLFYKPEVPFAMYNTLPFIVCSLRSHGVVFQMGAAECIPCLTSLCKCYLYSQLTQTEREGRRGWHLPKAAPGTVWTSDSSHRSLGQEDTCCTHHLMLKDLICNVVFCHSFSKEVLLQLLSLSCAEVS